MDAELPLDWRRQIFRAGVQKVVRGLLNSLTNYQIAGRELVPNSGPLLVVMNHLGLFDAPLLLATFPRSLDGVVLKDVLEIPVLGRLLKWYGVVPVKRDRIDRNVLRLTMALLRSGRAVAIAPEAGVSESGALRLARSGAAFLALETGAPILPVAFCGTETTHGIWDAQSKQLGLQGADNLVCWKRKNERLKISLTFGQPFRLSDYGQTWREKRQALGQATDELMARIAALLPAEYRGVYADKVPGRQSVS